MGNSDVSANEAASQGFTATGRPISLSKGSADGSGMHALLAAESLGAGPPNLLPARFQPESIISVPVMAPEGVSNAKLADSDEDNDDNPIKFESKSKGRFSFFRRKSSSSSPSKSKKPDFVMKEMTVAEYLKRYAKDDDGNYVGTQDAAPDCILRNEKDRTKYRKAHAFREAMATGNAPTFIV